MVGSVRFRILMDRSGGWLTPRNVYRSDIEVEGCRVRGHVQLESFRSQHSI